MNSFSIRFLAFYFFNYMFFISIQQANASYFHHPQLNTLIHIQSPTFSPSIGIQDFNITVLTTSYVLNDLCSAPPSNDVSGRIVLYDGDTNGCSHEDMCRNVQKSNGTGIIYISQSTVKWGKWGEAVHETSNGVYAVDSSDKSDIYIPYLHVVPKTIRSVVSYVEESGKGVILYVINDINPFLKPFNWLLFYRILCWITLTPWSLINTSLAFDTVYRLYKKEGKFSFKSLPQMACSIEIISNLLRLIFVSLGPFLTWDVLNFAAFNIMLSITWPLAFLTSFLIAIFWKAMSDQIKALTSTGLDVNRYKYIFAFVFLLEACSSWGVAIMRAMYMPLGIWVPGSAVIEFIASGGLAIYFIIQGRRLIAILENHEKTITSLITRSSSKDNLNNTTTSHGQDLSLRHTITRMSKWIMASAGFTLLFLVATVCCGSPLFLTRWGLSGFMYLLFVALLGTSSTQIVAFRTQVNRQERKDASRTASANHRFPIDSRNGSVKPGSARYQTHVFETQEMDDDNAEI